MFRADLRCATPASASLQEVGDPAIPLGLRLLPWASMTRSRWPSHRKKGLYDEIQERGLDQFRTDIRKIAPYLGDRVDELRDWDQIKIRTVQINRLRRWYRSRLSCIGDAAHAMSPAGGVGINLAIQDAVAATNLVTKPLLERCVPDAALAAVERRRRLPTCVTQGIPVGGPSRASSVCLRIPAQSVRHGN